MVVKTSPLEPAVAFGLLPMALSTGVGAETARPFAVVIIGGVFTGTILTLFILPLLYPRFEHKAPGAYGEGETSA